jgi:2-amino-4-hydroxy-6-hydroxymethyldihydropteridine diphosphokinase
VGDRIRNIRTAVGLLNVQPEITVTRVSAVYETEAMDDAVGQRDFYNAVAEVETDLAARELMTACKEIEQQLGRDPEARRHAPRPIDLDLVLFGDERIEEKDLVVPHPDLTRRRFVLVPLLQLAPDLPYREALDAIGEDQRVTMIDPLKE